MHVRVFLLIEQHRKEKGDDLADHRGDGGARDLHARQAEIAEDENGVEDDVDDRARSLCDHRVGRAAGGLQKPFKKHLAEDAEGGNADHADIVHAVGDGFRLRGQRAHIGLRAENAEQHAQEHSAGREHQTVERGGIDLLLIFLAQRARKQRIDADGHARRDTDHNILHREGKRNRGEGVVIRIRDARNKHAVYHIVKCLHQHGQRHRQRHAQKQPPHREDAHLVFFQGTHNSFHFLIIVKHYYYKGYSRDCNSESWKRHFLRFPADNFQMRPAVLPVSSRIFVKLHKNW